MRVFFGLTEIAGYYTHLSRALRAQGVRCTVLNLTPDPFRYGPPESGVLFRALQRAAAAGVRQGAAGAVWRLWGRILKSLVLASLLVTHDVFVFGFCSTFFGFRELPLLKLFGRRIIYVFHGSDSRPAYLDGLILGQNENADIAELVQEQKRKISRIERYADVIVCHTLSSHLHERAVIAFSTIGIPVCTPENVPTLEAATSSEVRILHSPSDPIRKGTDLIRSAVEKLRKEGHAVELVEVVNQPNSVVLSELAQCDFVVDEMYSDTFMATFATEAAHFGKPAIVGSYASAHLERLFGGSEQMPVLSCHPAELDAALRRLVSDSSFRQQLGARAKSFVSTEWSAASVAARFHRLCTGDVDSKWMFDPAETDYLHGYGMREEQARASVRGILGSSGVAGLCLSDKPSLVASLKEFARFGELPPEGSAPST